MSGSSKLVGLGGSVPLKGSFSAVADLSAGKYTGDLNLKATSGQFRIFGFLPVSANIGFDQVGQPTGTVSNKAVTFNGKLTIKLTKVALFGIPIYQGDSCKTKKPSDIQLKSVGNFDVLKGGKLKGKYSLSETVKCGPLSPIIGAFVASDGNTVDIDLAAKK
ncbi:Chitinase [Actinokineospora spheciospongiae]|uniref:Chitinase n=1 Tax=Actinokineospora spheciospongiae TaxID=909613 RepID=W7IUH4_9PSEU|nr:Chitinase [Actinokineospora spheciospongiae]